jgi:sugar diacid utilization regulator
MPTVDTLLRAATLDGLRRVSKNGGDREIGQAWVAESLQALEHAPPGSFVLLSGAASAEASGDYRLDMSLRWAALRGIPAVAAFAEGPWTPSATAVDIAERAGIALVWVPAERDLTPLLLALCREIEGGPAQALARAALILDFVAIAEPSAAGPDPSAPILAAAGTALGVPLELAPAPSPQVPSVPVVVAGELRGHIQPQAIPGRYPAFDGELATAARLALPAVAAAVARVLDAAERAADIPARSRAELLSTLLLSERTLDEDLLSWARQVGLRVDGWHIAVRVELDGLAPVDNELRRFEQLDAAARAALRAIQSPGGNWTMATLGHAIILARTTASDPGPQSGQRAARAATSALDAITAKLPGVAPRAGVGAAHEGLVGLRASAAEARSALTAARATSRGNRVATYDAVGIQRMLTEWYASDTVREAVREQLAPLEQLGGAKAETAIQTLKVYLDEQGSIARTAAVLHLHRNAVTYRLQRITELVGVDLTNPDHRLALQLACRARLLP